ncbi:MAG: clostripain-related cysteine peptidase, partial [Anaerolineae bacterium]
MNKRTTFRTATVLAILALLLALAAPATAAPPPGKGKPPAQAKWTFLVYIVGDNNLDEYVPLDIETELAPAGSNEDVSVVALADRAATAEWTQTLLFYVTQGMEATPENALEDWGEANMGDPQTLISFIQWAKDTYPAEHYALSLWNHGWSWRPDHTMSDETNGDTLDQHELEAVLDEVGPIDV